MTAALGDSPAKDFELEKPEYVTVHIDAESGLLAGPWCAGSVAAKFVKGKEPRETTTTCVERDRPVPELVGLTIDEARALLEEQSFEVTPKVEDQLVTDPEQGGVVLRQQPAAGERVFRDDPITLVVGDHPFSD